jgi:hypothetical protein
VSGEYIDHLEKEIERRGSRIAALEAALERSVSRGSDAVVQIATLSHALREIAQKRKMDAVAAASMQAIARAALAPSGPLGNPDDPGWAKARAALAPEQGK